MTSQYVDFRDLTPKQRMEARALRPNWPISEFLRVSFWVKADGHLSRRTGHHQITDVEGKKIEALAKDAWDRTPKMSKKWKSATFHFAPER